MFFEGEFQKLCTPFLETMYPFFRSFEPLSWKLCTPFSQKLWNPFLEAVYPFLKAVYPLFLEAVYPFLESCVPPFLRSCVTFIRSCTQSSNFSSAYFTFSHHITLSTQIVITTSSNKNFTAFSAICKQQTLSNLLAFFKPAKQEQRIPHHLH